MIELANRTAPEPSPAAHRSRPSAEQGGAIRRIWRLRQVAVGCLALLVAGCGLAVGDGPGNSSDRVELVWGRRGISAGRLRRPRAMAIDAQDQLYIVDMTGRIQVFSRDGEYVRGWRTPAIDQGKPCGLSFDHQGNLMVADTHYFRVLFYTPLGVPLEDRTLGGQYGPEAGQFHFVTDAVQDSRGNYYVAEYGECDRIQKFTAAGRFILQWGGHGNAPGQFRRPQSLAVDGQDHLWVADACNHRIQVFDASGAEPRLVRLWGRQGTAAGELSYPYGLVLDPQAPHVYVCEFGNQRVQKFTVEGQSLGCWGTGGRRPGELSRPWALVLDSQHRLHVLDTYNHRVQRIQL